MDMSREASNSSLVRPRDRGGDLSQRAAPHVTAAALTGAPGPDLHGVRWVDGARGLVAQVEIEG